MQKLLIISYDALGDEEFEQLCTYPHFRALAARSAVARRVKSLFLSNTYPIHTSVATGVTPEHHRLISNTEPHPDRWQHWNTDAALIQAKTLWQAAQQKGLRTAAVMWPVTARAREIRYNVPEVMALPGKSQVLTSLAAGSKWLQIRLALRYHKLMDSIGQPALDRFSGACMADILRGKKPDLALMHFTAYDTLCHKYGRSSPRLAEALAVMDEGLGKLLEAVGEDYAILLFSDHAQLDARRHILPDMLLSGMGNRFDCFVECCGGSAFLHPGSLDAAGIERLRARIAQTEGFQRFLTSEEMATCGRAELPFGFCAKVGYCYLPHDKEEISNHGFPLDYNHYEVFFMAAGNGFFPGTAVTGGNLLDIAPIAAQILNLDMPGIRVVREDFLQTAAIVGGNG